MIDKDKIVLSSLGHTWLIDIDGTVAKHNGYKIDGYDTLLPHVKDFFESIPKQDRIIFLTSRKEKYREETERFLANNGIKFDLIIYGLPYGERIVINDNKPSGLEMSIAVCLERDEGLNANIEIDGSL